MQHDITLIRKYLNIHSTGKLNPNIIDPIHLRQVLNCPYVKAPETTFGITRSFNCNPSESWQQIGLDDQNTTHLFRF